MMLEHLDQQKRNLTEISMVTPDQINSFLLSKINDL